MALNQTGKTGNGGFYFPQVYKKSQTSVWKKFSSADIDYADLTQWSFPDEFLCFVIQVGLLEFVDSTYPNPRDKNEVPIWFLVSCQFLLRIYQSGRYHHLNYLLNAGSILTQFGFNVGSNPIGFNEKNKQPRKTAVDADTVRKFFRDSKKEAICARYRDELQSWFKSKQAFNAHGIFVLDQSHLVVPDNANYKASCKMPVDEHGQFYTFPKGISEKEKKSFPYHRCYALSTLLHVGFDNANFHVASYELGPGNEDELVQAKQMIPAFCKKFPGLMKELIIDRGYIDGAFMTELKQVHNVDCLIPLKNNMATYQEAIAIATQQDKWTLIEEKRLRKRSEIILRTEAVLINDIALWDALSYKQQVVVSRYREINTVTGDYVDRFGVLSSTKKYTHPKTMLRRYQLRWSIEERFRQFKNDWYIAKFPSPHASLIESHVCFTLLTYSLLQMYFRKKDLQAKTGQMISSLRQDEKQGKDAVIIYSKDEYGVFDLDVYTIGVADMKSAPRERLKSIMEAQKKARLKRT